MEKIKLNSPYSHRNSERTPKVTYFIKRIGRLMRPWTADTITVKRVKINIFL